MKSITKYKYREVPAKIEGFFSRNWVGEHTTCPQEQQEHTESKTPTFSGSQCNEQRFLQESLVEDEPAKVGTVTLLTTEIVELLPRTACQTSLSQFWWTGLTKEDRTSEESE